MGQKLRSSQTLHSASSPAENRVRLHQSLSPQGYTVWQTSARLPAALVTYPQQAHFLQSHPDCFQRHSKSQVYGSGLSKVFFQIQKNK